MTLVPRPNFWGGTRLWWHPCASSFAITVDGVPYNDRWWAINGGAQGVAMVLVHTQGIVRPTQRTYVIAGESLERSWLDFAVSYVATGEPISPGPANSDFTVTISYP